MIIFYVNIKKKNKQIYWGNKNTENVFMSSLGYRFVLETNLAHEAEISKQLPYRDTDNILL